MKRILLAGVGLLALSAAASAADLTYEPPPAAPIAPIVAPSVFDWTGFYVGVHGGGAWSDFSSSYVDGFGNTSAALGGAQVGYNYQVDKWVFGIQTDLAYTGISASNTLVPGVDLNVDASWYGTTTARVGYAMDTWLLYAKGGVAYAQLEANIDTILYSESSWHAGWTVGAGVEKAFTPNITGFLEYNYADLGNNEIDTVLGSIDTDFSTNIVKAGINYKF